MRAETLDQAFAAVVKKVREDTKAEHVYFIARDDEGKLVKKSHAGPPKPPFQVREHAFAKAKAALDRLAARRKEAADKGEDVRELGTDVPEDVTSHATSVWLPERDFGAIAIVRLGQKPFTFDELDALWEAGR